MLDHPSPFRYGIFMRPGPAFGETALRAMEIAHRQFGFRAAISYPPHTTLVGSLALAVPERSLLDVLDKQLASRAAVPMWNKGLGSQFGDSIGYNVNEDGAGSQNRRLRELVTDLFTAVEPLRTHPPTDRGIAKRKREDGSGFEGHLTVVGHDGADNLALTWECLEYLRTLGLDGPATDPGDTVSLYRFHAQDWAGRYWETMQWAVVKSWKLG
ncbi:MAG: hypothetical protein L0G87_02215 [Renibacterium salmoninarum]|nr:hypothetical protein [Renibacterium salmoninarum]